MLIRLIIVKLESKSRFPILEFFLVINVGNPIESNSFIRPKYQEGRINISLFSLDLLK